MVSRDLCGVRRKTVRTRGRDRIPEREVGVVFALLRVEVIAEDISRDISAKRAVFRRELPERALVPREKQLDYFLVVQNLTSFASFSSYKTDFFEEGFNFFEKFTNFFEGFEGII